MSYDFVAFTTARDERPLYRRDALNAIAYPDGWTIVLTYRGKWVDDEIWEAARAGLPYGWSNRSLQGAVLLLVLGLREKVKHEEFIDKYSNDFVDYVPLRYGTVLAAEAVGEQYGDGVLTLFMRLHERPSRYQLGAETFRRECNLLGINVPQLTRGDSKYLMKARNSTFINRGRSAGRPLGRSVEWETQVDRLSQFPEFSGCTFIRLESIAARSPSYSHSDPVAPEIRNVSPVTVLQLTAGQAYEMRFHVHGESLARRDEPLLEFTPKDAHFEVFDPAINQFGHRSAVVEYIIAAQRRFSATTVSLVARTLTADGKSTLTGDAPEFQVYLEIRPPGWLLPTVFLLFAGGTFMLNYPKPGAGDSETMFYLFRSIGAVCLGVAGFLSLQKLPVKL